MLEYINQLRVQGHTIEEAAIEGAVLRLRPIMMTMLVATTGHKLVRHTTTCMRGAQASLAADGRRGRVAAPGLRRTCGPLCSSGKLC